MASSLKETLLERRLTSDVKNELELRHINYGYR